MIRETIYLKDVIGGMQSEAKLTSYVHSNFDGIEARQRAAVVVCPGGAYYDLSLREKEPIALSFFAKGYNAFVLEYSTANISEKKYPTQLLESSAAFAYIRRNCEKYNTKKDAIMIAGFSAGGHMAAMLGTLWNDSVVAENLDIEAGKNRPDGVILAYPVISGGEFAHRGSFDNLLGEKAQDEDLLFKLSLENSVGPHNPPTFLWHTLTDELVPVENAFLFANAMKKANVPFEMHIYPEGPHGIALGTLETSAENDMFYNLHVASWMGLCDNWIKRFIDK